MSDSPSDAEQTAQRATEHAEEAARKLDRARSDTDAEAATAADVDDTAAEVQRQPSEESARESDVTGPGAPMP